MSLIFSSQFRFLVFEIHPASSENHSDRISHVRMTKTNMNLQCSAVRALDIDRDIDSLAFFCPAVFKTSLPVKLRVVKN